jgi:hypothetical protein
VPGLGYQAEQQRDQGPVGPGHLRPNALAELALDDGKLMAQQKDLCVIPRCIATGQPRYREETGGE